MLFCDHIVSTDDFKILATSDSDFQVKVKESLLISRDEPTLNKNEMSLLTHMKLNFNDIYYSYIYCINVTIVS